MPPSARPGPWPFGAWQKLIGMGLFGAIYSGLAVYTAVERDWTAFTWIAILGLLSLASAVGGLLTLRRKRQQVITDELQRQARSQQHPPQTPHRSRKRHRR
jgi:LPXTG-motif cell wall-anchored protein